MRNLEAKQAHVLQWVGIEPPGSLKHSLSNNHTQKTCILHSWSQLVVYGNIFDKHSGGNRQKGE